MDNHIRVQVPCSTANLGPGFDAVGMAFQLYLSVEMKYSDQPKVELVGHNLEGLPEDDSNLVYQVAQQVFREAKRDEIPLHIKIESDIPLTRGLGSSAAAIIGGMVAANALLGQPLSKERIFEMATALEGHPDNVGASLYGGIIFATMSGERVPFVRIEPSTQLLAVVVIPDYQLKTEKAREVLPLNYNREQVVHAITHASLLAATLITERYELLGEAMKDRIHQPYRSTLIPGMAQILEEGTLHGAYGTALSGAGPTMIGFTNQENAERLTLFFAKVMEEHHLTYRTETLSIDCVGAQVIELKAFAQKLG